MNVRNIINKHKELQLLAMEENLDLIAITETSLTEKIQDSFDKYFGLSAN